MGRNSTASDLELNGSNRGDHNTALLPVNTFLQTVCGNRCFLDPAWGAVRYSEGWSLGVPVSPNWLIGAPAHSTNMQTATGSRNPLS